MEIVSLDDISAETEKFGEVFFKSNFKHLQDHNGHRPGEMSTLIGPKGSGKSSVLRSWILECLLQQKRVFLHLSEEQPSKYMGPIAKALMGVLKDKNKAQDVLNNLRVQSEKSFDNQYQKEELVKSLEYRIKESGSQIAIIDNFTTSAMSQLGISKEAEYALKLSHLADKLDVPIIVVCHTEKAFRNKTTATGEDIRGNMTMSNTAAVIYVVNTKLEHPEKPSFLLVDKSRYHSRAHKQVYKLQYDTKDCIFFQDTRSDMETMQTYWQTKKKERR